MPLPTYLPADAPELIRLYKAIGFTIDHKEDRILAEVKDGRAVCLKTFSNMGYKDIATADNLRAYFTAQNIPFTSSQPRIVIVNKTDFDKLFSKLTMDKVLAAHAAGGVLDGDPISGTDKTWDEYIQAFDLDDPKMVEFLAQWRTFLDAQNLFSKQLVAVAEANSYMVTNNTFIKVV